MAALTISATTIPIIESEAMRPENIGILHNTGIPLLQIKRAVLTLYLMCGATRSVNSVMKARNTYTHHTHTHTHAHYCFHRFLNDAYLTLPMPVWAKLVCSSCFAVLQREQSFTVSGRNDTSDCLGSWWVAQAISQTPPSLSHWIPFLSYRSCECQISQSFTLCACVRACVRACVCVT